MAVRKFLAIVAAAIITLLATPLAVACPDGQSQKCAMGVCWCDWLPPPPPPPIQPPAQLDPFRQQREDSAKSLAGQVNAIVPQVQNLPEAVRSGANTVASALAEARAAAAKANDLANQASDAAVDAGTDAAREAASAAAKAAQEVNNIVGNVVHAAAEVTTAAATKAETAARQSTAQVSKAAQEATQQAADLSIKAAEQAYRIAQQAADQAQAAAVLAHQYAEQAKTDAAKVAAQAADEAAAAASDFAKNAGTAVDKAARDVAWNLAKSGGDIVDAAKALETYAENERNGLGDTLSSAERRLREGKVVDAFWEAAIDSARQTDKDAAKALASSSVLRAAAQAAATAYGGPAGAAAFAAWYTYHETGNADLALRVGLLTGVAGELDPAGVDTSTVSGVLKKSAMSGAMAGLTVAAAGGDADAVKAAFIQASEAVIVQEASAAGKTALKDAYCMGADDTCELPDPSQIKAKAGEWAEGKAEEITGIDVADIEVPGKNAMTILQGQYALAWDPEVLKKGVGPADVLSYIGDGSPYYDELQHAVAAGKALSSPDNWQTAAADGLGLPNQGYVVEFIAPAQGGWLPTAPGLAGMKTFMCIARAIDASSNTCYAFFAEPQTTTIHLGLNTTIRRTGDSWNESPEQYGFITSSVEPNSVTLFDGSRDFSWKLPVPGGPSEWKKGDGSWTDFDLEVHWDGLVPIMSSGFKTVTGAEGSPSLALFAGGPDTSPKLAVPVPAAAKRSAKFPISDLQRRALIASVDQMAAVPLPMDEANCTAFVEALAGMIHLTGVPTDRLLSADVLLDELASH